MKRSLLTAVLIALLLLTACTAPPDEGYTIPVVLQLPDGAAAVDGISRAVPPGGDAVFAVEISPGYEVILPEDCTLTDGILTVHDVLLPRTISLTLRFNADQWPGLSPDQIPAGGEFAFSVTADRKHGSVTASHADGSYPAGTEITLSAAPDEGFRFVCWSIGGPVAEGGTPISDSPDYRFLLGTPLVFCANFAADHTATLIYDTNGGRASVSGGRFLREDSDLTDYITPHTMLARGQMIREGYVLYAYNTAPDGSGREYTFGANVPIARGETATLYAMWAEVDASVFSWKPSGSGVQITACTADTETVVLPETLDGKKVERIAAGAFSDLENLRTLITTPNLQVIAAGAIKNCPAFTTLYLCDSIVNIPDNFYANCPEFRTLKLGAVRAPTYGKTRQGSYAIKFQRLISVGTPKLVVVSGSSSAHGLSSPQLEELLENRYAVVNYSTVQHNSSALYVELAAAFMQAGDILLFAPEPHFQQLGSNNVITSTWQNFEGAPEAISYVDLRRYNLVFSSLTAYNASRSNMKAGSFADYDSAGELNAYGDIAFLRPNNKNENYVVSRNSITLDFTLLTDGRAARLNDCFALVRERGADVYLSFAPMNVNALAGSAKSSSRREKYSSVLESKLDAVRISTVDDCLFAGIYITDYDMHLNTEGTVIRTERLANDIIARLKAEGKWH